MKYRSYLERLDEIPPPMCRLIARTSARNPRILTIMQIAERSGLPWQTVAAIARRKSFARVPVEDADKYRLGCGITPENEKRHREYILRNNQRANGWAKLLQTTKPGLAPSHRKKFVDRILKRL